MKYASIDVETTGLDKVRCQMIEIAVVVDDTAAAKTLGFPDVEKLPTFRAIAWPTHDACWEPEAVAMHEKNGLLAELREGRYARERGFVPRPEYHHRLQRCLLWGALFDFLQEHFGRDKRIVVAGKNFNGFDRHFIRGDGDGDGAAGDIERRLHHRLLDPGAQFVDFELDADSPPSLETLLKRHAVVAGGTHRALDDARDVVRLLRTRYAR